MARVLPVLLAAAVAVKLASAQPLPPRNVTAFAGDSMATVYWTPQDGGQATQYESE